MPYLCRASSVGTPISPINITNGPFVRLIPSIYIQNINLFGVFDPEKHRFQLAQREYKISQKLPVNLKKLQTLTKILMVCPRGFAC